MGLDVLHDPTPHVRIAGAPFTLELGLYEEDGTAYGAPEDVSDVTAVRVTAEKQVAAGADAATPVIWTTGDGAALVTVNDPLTSQDVGTIRVSEAAGLEAGTYDLKWTMTRTGGAVDFVQTGYLQLVEQP